MNNLRSPRYEPIQFNAVPQSPNVCCKRCMVMVDGIECRRHVERDHDGGTARVDGTVDVIRHLDQRCFGGMSSTVRRLQWVEIR